MTNPSTIPTPLPRVAAFERLGYGMFIHWGLYSQLGKGEWIQKHGPIDRAEYVKLKDTFTAADFDADAIAGLAVEAGMKYICLTTRHHDGFSLYDTRSLNDYDAPHSPAGRDLVAEFIDACRRHELLPMLYHTTLDWHWRGKMTPELDADEFRDYLQYHRDSVEVLCSQYGPIGGLWFDGNWSRRGDDWEEDTLYEVIRRHQPEAIIVNNTGLSAQGAEGHPEIDSVTFEQHTPTVRDQRGKAKYVAGEMCQTMNAHWGIGKHDFRYKSPADVIRMLCQCRRVGANYLLNVGPTATGAIPEYETAVLRRVGQWVEQVGEVIYVGKPMSGVDCPEDDFILQTGDADYYFAFNLTRGGGSDVTLKGGSRRVRAIQNYPHRIASIAWCDNGETLSFTQTEDRRLAAVHLTGYGYGTDLVARIARITRNG